MKIEGLAVLGLVEWANSRASKWDLVSIKEGIKHRPKDHKYYMNPNFHPKDRNDC